jgi:hypothetical protein
VIFNRLAATPSSFGQSCSVAALVDLTVVERMPVWLNEVTRRYINARVGADGGDCATRRDS